MMKYLFTAFAVSLIVWWAVAIYLHIGTRTLAAFVGLLTSILSFILAVTFLVKGFKAFLISQVVGFGVILSLVALFVYLWRKDSEEQAGRIYKGGR